MWANRSSRSPKMSDYERFAQVAHQKWATMSESLKSLTKNERMRESLIFLSKLLIRLFFGKKRAIRSENWWANSQLCIFVFDAISSELLVTALLFSVNLHMNLHLNSIFHHKCLNHDEHCFRSIPLWHKLSNATVIMQLVHTGGNQTHSLLNYKYDKTSIGRYI